MISYQAIYIYLYNCLINCTKYDLLTEHFIITFTIIFHLLPYLSNKSIRYIKIKYINILLFSSEVVSILVSLPISPESHDSILTLILDKYDHLQSINSSLHIHFPLFSSDIVKLKRLYVKLKDYIVEFLLLNTFCLLLII